MGGSVQKVAKAAATVAAGPVGLFAGNVATGTIDRSFSNNTAAPSVNLNDATPREVGRTLASGVKGVMAGGKSVAQDIGLLKPDPDMPNIAEPESPADTAAADKAARDKAKRQAKIDILTDRPGRGGTILTDQYQYNVG